MIAPFEIKLSGLNSAISYAPLFIGKRTVVVGDGDLALRALTELALESKFMRYLAILDKDGRIIDQSDFPAGFAPLNYLTLAPHI